MLRGIDNNSGVPAPDCQIAGLRMADASEIVDSVVEMGGIGVAIRKAGQLVNSMYDVRAVSGGVRGLPGFKCSSDNRQAFIRSEKLRRVGLRILPRDCFSGVSRRGLRNLLPERSQAERTGKRAPNQQFRPRSAHIS